ncbi:MAG TPA: hypothetical protein VKR79_11980 [Gaiellaceae bacterium]|nr:hypothetical protein [Gaiellaceae bacterium]
MRRASLALATVLLAAGLLPATASAHVGRTPPAATDYLARISYLPPGLTARIVDGDQAMWMRAEPSLTVMVTGLRGEPYLRFSPAGVAVNTHSATWFLNRVRPEVIPQGITSSTPPQWQQLTSLHWWTWHEGRLHTPALSAHPSGNTYLGRWVVPLVVDGRGTAISGGLWQSAPASLLWFWPLLLVAACIPALLKVREARLETQVGVGLAVLALVASTTARLGRELYGRPTISSWQLALVGVTCLVALGLALLYSRREWRPVAGILVGIAAAAQGLELVSTLRDGWVLAAIPAWLERSATGLSLASGVALVLVSLRLSLPGRAEEPDTELLAQG